MQKDEKIYQEDAEHIIKCKGIDWDQLKHARILVTGAAGLIGKTLIKGLMEYNRICDGDVKVVACVRNKGYAEEIFSSFIDRGVEIYFGDVVNPFRYEGHIDYIIHGASTTSSKSFVERPVETIRTEFCGTCNLLEFAREKKIKGMVYMSSYEIYGVPKTSEALTEDKMGYLNPLSVRSSYSESKRMCENLCVSYASEYQVPVKIVRLTQTFGPGIKADDSRVFSEFAGCAMNGQDICLQTAGETERMYLYTADAVSALLTVLTKGTNAAAYNAANKSTYCSIKNMANMVMDELGNGSNKVTMAASDKKNNAYNPVNHIYLDTTELEALGWSAAVGLSDMYKRMAACMKTD